MDAIASRISSLDKAILLLQYVVYVKFKLI